ncbi:MAG: NAD(P)-dependent alcohol dehydrogenase [Gemmataceae bacterium]
MTTIAYRFMHAGTGNWIGLDPEFPLKELEPNEVHIRVRAASLNFRDLIHAKKQLGRDYAGKVPLSDGAGEVVAIGSAVTRVKVGDRVVSCFFQSWISGRFQMSYHDSALGGSLNGMLAKDVILNEDGVVKIPPHLSFSEAACLPCAGLTAWYSLVTRGEFQIGDTVLVLGTGGVSIFALQLGVALGGRVAITSSSDEKLVKAKALGAEFGVNYKTTPDWDKEIWKWSGKNGVDHIVEVGGPGTIGKSLNCVAPGGHIALVGVLSGVGPPDASLFPLLSRNATLSGIYVGSRNDFEKMNCYLAEKKIKPVVERVFDFGNAIAAFKYLESAAHFGKVVIQID